MKKIILLLVFFLLLFLLNYIYLTPSAYDKRWFNESNVNKGKSIFLTNCASCHKEDASGTRLSKKTNKDGFYPPPPLNGQAHTWHHDYNTLAEIITKGGKLYNGKMPAFEKELNKNDIKNVIAYFQSFWKDDVYDIWKSMKKNSDFE